VTDFGKWRIDMKTLLTTTAFVALLATAPAIAQSDNAPAAEQPPAATETAPDQGMAPADPNAPAPEAPAATDTAPADQGTTAAPADPNAPATTAEQPMDQEPPAATAEQPTDQAPAATAEQPTDQPDATVAAAPDKVFIDKQAAEDRLASNWIGQTIYNQANESVGDVNDLLIDKDGKIAAVIIGVGGFLGIGEKNVAISFDSIQSSTDENGNLKFMVSVTKEELDAAPEFMTLADLQAQSEAPAAPEAAPDAMAPAPAPAQ
jgi:sporulation protein YlmC with PRC-barrel domain